MYYRLWQLSQSLLDTDRISRSLVPVTKSLRQNQKILIKFIFLTYFGHFLYLWISFFYIWGIFKIWSQDLYFEQFFFRVKHRWSPRFLFFFLVGISGTLSRFQAGMHIFLTVRKSPKKYNVTEINCQAQFYHAILTSELNKKLLRFKKY